LDGEVLATSHFAEGKPKGKWKTLHDDGSPRFAGSFENGEKTGVHRWWKKNGKLRRHFLYHNGNPVY
jgi:antitoxin component YwqK of YwqJK toxin-antitoxin module